MAQKKNIPLLGPKDASAGNEARSLHGLDALQASPGLNDEGSESGDSYHAHNAWVVTSTSLRDFLKSPAYYYNKYVSRVIPNEETEAMRFGSAFHQAVLEPDKFEQNYYADRYRRNTRESKALAAEMVGKERLTEHEHALCELMAKIAWEHPTAQEECRTGVVEHPIMAKMRNGLTVKCKPDLINERGIYDLKSMGKPINMFGEHAFALNYHIQAAFYTGVLIGSHDALKRDFNFWVVTKRAPYQCGFFRISWVECANVWREVCVPALNDLARLLRSDEWHDSNNGNIDRTLHIPAKLTKYRGA